MKRLFFCFLILPLVLSAQQAPVQLRVLTYNIYHGETMQGNFDLDLIAEVIESAQPDLVALQEVDFRTCRAKGMDLVSELGYRTHMIPLFGRAMPFDGGEYGEGILSRYSFTASRLIALPAAPDHEPRAALAVDILLPSGDTITFAGTHLDHLRDPADRIRQAEALNRALAGGPYPAVLAGDLNALPGSEPLRILQRHWTPTHGAEAAPTYPADAPEKKIDYILYAPAARWRVVETQVLHAPQASDHCPYLVVLELLPE